MQERLESALNVVRPAFVKPEVRCFGMCDTVAEPGVGCFVDDDVDQGAVTGEEA